MNKPYVQEAEYIQNVIIYGDCWPIVSAVQHLVRAIRPEYCCEVSTSLTDLIKSLTTKSEAVIILCLRPREHIYLFYALKQALMNHPALIISDELFFSDRLVLQCWGGLPFTNHQEITILLEDINKYGCPPHSQEDNLSRFLSAPSVATGYFEVPMIFYNSERLMNYMELLMYRATVSCGVTQDQQKLMEEVHKGQCSLSGLKNKLNKNERQIWQDKNRLLVKLGMKNRLHELLYGTRFCPDKQRTPFLSPDKILSAE